MSQGRNVNVGGESWIRTSAPKSRDLQSRGFSHSPISPKKTGSPSTDRTYDLRINSATPYRLAIEERCNSNIVARMAGFEPATSGFVNQRSQSN
jgi:hypothetical protein